MVMDFDQKLDIAWSQGYQAAHDGLEWDDNPYNGESEPDLHEAWLAGYKDIDEDVSDC